MTVFRYPRAMQRGVWINLLPEEIAWADEDGTYIYESAVQNKRRQKHGAAMEKSPWPNRYAMRCEYALAYFLGIMDFRASRDTFKTYPDVGHCDVRSRTWERVESYPVNYLLVRPDDPPERPYVLVYGGDRPWYLLAGWLYGREAQQDQWRKASMGRQTRKGDAYWVPEAALRCPSELIK